MKKFTLKIFAFVLAALLCLSGCENEKITTSIPNDNAVVADLPSADFSLKASATKEVSGADTTITLKDSTAEIKGSGAAREGDDIVITKGGSYAVSGRLENGRIVISAGSSEVTVILNGADITSNYSSAFFVQKAGAVTLTAYEGSVNILKDAAQYDFTDKYSNSAKSEPDACLYSENDLKLNGEGRLLIKGNFKNGVTGKTVLNIENASLTVSSVGHGITGKEELILKSTAFNVTSGGDGLRANSTANASLGRVALIDSVGSIQSGEDGVQAETTLYIESGSYSVTSGGGCENEVTAEISTKAFKGGSEVNISDGIITADALDDSIHSNGNVNISGGSLALKSGDDAIHSDYDISISGGTVFAESCYEGLEATNITLSGGEIKLTAFDDGVNISGGDGSGEMARPGMDFFAASGGKLIISGGRLIVNAEGDGLDANGDIEISGGLVIVNGPTRGGNGVMDYDGEFLITGGEFIAVGSSSMAQNPSEDSTQNSLIFTDFSGAENEIFSILASNGTEILSYSAIKSFDWVLYSSPNIKNGESYTAYIGGSHSGTSSDGVYSGGKYSLGTKIAELTVQSAVTSNGTTNGMGGHHGHIPGGRPNANKGERPFSPTDFEME